jgi:hypothetical protein
LVLSFGAQTQAQVTWTIGPTTTEDINDLLNGSGTWGAGKLFLDLFGGTAGDAVSLLDGDNIKFGDANLGLTGTYTVTLSFSPNVGSLTFFDNYSLTSAAPFTLTIGSGGILVSDGVASIGGGGSPLGVKLGDDQTWRNQSYTLGTFTVGAAVNFNGKNLTLDGYTGTTTVLSGSLNIGNSVLNVTGAGSTVLSGPISLSAGTLQMSGTGSTLLSGLVTGGSLANLSKQGIGALTVNNIASLNAFGAGILLGQGSLVLATDTNVSATAANISTGVAFSPTLVVKQATSGANRTVTLGGLLLGPQDPTISLSNGNGLVFSGSSNLGDGGYGIFVAGAQASNMVSGLTFSGIIAGTGTFLKKGPGTMLLTNSSHTSSTARR